LATEVSCAGEVLKVHKEQYICNIGIEMYVKYLTPWSRVLPEKLAGPQLLKKFLTFYGTRQFIITFTRAHNLSVLSQIIPVHVPPSHFSKIHFKTVFPFMHGSSKWSLLVSGFPTKTLYAPLLSAICATCTVDPSLFDLIT
jgi:hypothetical protein